MTTSRIERQPGRALGARVPARPGVEGAGGVTAQEAAAGAVDEVVEGGGEQEGEDQTEDDGGRLGDRSG